MSFFENYHVSPLIQVSENKEPSLIRLALLLAKKHSELFDAFKIGHRNALDVAVPADLYSLSRHIPDGLCARFILLSGSECLLCATAKKECQCCCDK